MKRASAAMAREAAADNEMESGELTDSEDEGAGSASTEGRRRSKKKKHRHDKEYWNAKKHRKRERKRERRDRHSEEGSSNQSPAAEPGERAAKEEPVPAAVPRRSDALPKLPRIPRLPACASVSCVKTATPKPSPAGPPEPQERPEPAAFAFDLSDDEMGEADLRIVEETGESPHYSQEELVIADSEP